MIENKFPKKRIKFYKRAHRYVLDKKTELVSVTTWLKSFFEKFDANKAVYRSLASKRKKGDTTSTVKSVLKEWKKSRDDGSAVHKEIEEYIDRCFNMEPSLPKAVVGAQYVSSNFGACDLYPEQLIYDEAVGLAGTTDLVVANDDGTLTLVDWKTNKSIYQKAFDKLGKGACSNIPDCNYWHYYIQLSMYAYLLSLKGFTVKNCILAHLKDDKVETYEIIPSFSIIDAMLAERNGHQMPKGAK